YLDLKIEYQQLDEMYSYAQQVLLNYAAWMSENEYPYLSKPERLEYPTETWAAQDMRKSEVFKYAMKHASEPARSRLWERAEYFFRYSTSALKEMPTRTYCRPVVLLLSFGWMHAYFQRHPQIAAPISPVAHSATTPLRFVPQKIVAKKRVKVIAAGLAAAGVVAIAATVYYLL
ncbi:MAG: hypothetical protein SGJ20_02140, partial [Planctomycetota bacterium]|nr:hypothetical protein [Planctomycetota bacterium]